MGSTIGGVFTLSVMGVIGFVFYRLGHEARSRTTQALGFAALFIVLCAAIGSFY